MPSKQFMKGKNIINLYPTDKQLAQLKQKMADNGYKVMSKYLIDMGLKATVKTEIVLDSTHKNNTVSKEIDDSIKSPTGEIYYKSESKPQQPKSTMVKPLTKGGK